MGTTLPFNLLGKKGSKEVGTVRLRRMEDAENDLHELKLKRWRSKNK
jgi:hypothetical protein